MGLNNVKSEFCISDEKNETTKQPVKPNVTATTKSSENVAQKNETRTSQCNFVMPIKSLNV